MNHGMLARDRNAVRRFLRYKIDIDGVLFGVFMATANKVSAILEREDCVGSLPLDHHESRMTISHQCPLLNAYARGAHAPPGSTCASHPPSPAHRPSGR